VVRCGSKAVEDRRDRIDDLGICCYGHIQRPKVHSRAAGQPGSSTAGGQDLELCHQIVRHRIMGDGAQPDLRADQGELY